MSSEEAEKESTNSDSNDDNETHVTGSMFEPSTTKKLKKFDFITKDGRHIHLTEEEINHQKNLEEDVKAEAAKQEGEVKKAELVYLFGPEVIQTRMDYLQTTEAELGINLDIPLSEQDHLDKLNNLANKKKKHADDIHDYFKANKRLKSSVQYEDHLPGTVLNEPVLGPRLDDHARTFNSLLLAEIDKRNLNPLKLKFQFDLLKFLQLQLFRSLEDWEVSSLQFMQRVILFSIHSDNGNPSSVIIKQHCGRYQDYQDRDCQWRLLVSFQDDTKYEHVGNKTQDRKMAKMLKIIKEKDLKILELKTKLKDNDKGSRSKITHQEGTSLQRR
ncbi:hypothetical protein Tco_1440217 [Tanacetum coccineum]